MVEQIRILTKAQLCNVCNINVVRFSKDKGKRAGLLAVMAAWIVLIAMLWFYVGMMSYGYISIGLGDVMPMLLIAVSGIIILSFGILKAGSVIFQKNSYEMLCSMPVSQTAIVVSRFLSMYLGNLVLAFLIMIPGMAVQGYLQRPGISYYVIGILGTCFVPLLPMTVATLLGALVSAVSSRMKHKSLVTTVLTILLVLGIMGLSSGLTQIEEDLTPAMLLNLSSMSASMIEKVYPPALWLGKSMIEGSAGDLLLFVAISAVVFLAVAAVISANFTRICRGLYSVSAKHDYKMQELKTGSLLMALYKKEAKRYFASSTYVTNTIVGPVMMVLFAGMIFASGEKQIQTYFPFMDDVIGLVPFVLSAVACMMVPACVSISMEGKEWWIIKSLPIPAKTIFDSKILFSLSLIAPFYVVSELLLILALKPQKMELFWMMLLPVLFLVFACVFGITANLWLPVFDWENEVSVVKRSASAMVGGLGGMLMIILMALPVVFLRQVPEDLIKAVIGVCVTGVTAFLYGKMINTDLRRV